LPLNPKKTGQRFQPKFHHHFEQIPTQTKPTQELQIEVYSNALPTSISMFIKRATKHTLAKNFKEYKTIEFQMKGFK
jgi:hypothetical protein